MDKKLKGICHQCYSTNVEIELVDGSNRCNECKNNMELEEFKN